MGSLSSGDWDLFESGLFADVTVQCGESKWALHKNILCSRSDWFRKALNGHFEEARTGVITIHDQNPEAVGWVLKWIYTGQYSKESHTNAALNCTFDDQETKLFCLDELCNLSEGRLKEVLRDSAHWVQEYFTQGDHYREIDEDMRKGIVRGVETAYRMNREKYRGIFSGFMKATHLLVLKDDNFNKVFDSVPEFAIDTMKEATLNHFRHNLCGELIDNSCGNCGECKDSSEVFFRELQWDAAPPLCNHCSDKPLEFLEAEGKYESGLLKKSKSADTE